MKNRLICVGSLLSTVVAFIFIINMKFADVTWMGMVNNFLTIAAFLFSYFTTLHYIINGFSKEQ